MALDKRVRQFRITANSTDHDLSTQNMTLNWVNEYYNDSQFDKDAAGNLRQRLAGVRANIRIRYDANTDGSGWRNLLNDLITHFATNNNDSCTFYPDATKTTASDGIDVVLDGDWAYRAEYRNQIYTFIPSIRLIGYSRQTTIPSDLQA